MASKHDKTLICKFWLKGRCDRGEGCKYAHGEAEKNAACKVIMCQFIVGGGRCRLGAECLYKHSEDEALENTSGRSDSGEISSEEANLDVARSARRNSLDSRKKADMGSSAGEFTSRYAAGWQNGSFDKTALCKFFAQNKCQRGAGCKYAHGEDEQRRACQSIPCKHGADCTLGAACMYAHPEPEKTEDENEQSDALKSDSDDQEEIPRVRLLHNERWVDLESSDEEDDSDSDVKRAAAAEGSTTGSEKDDEPELMMGSPKSSPSYTLVEDQELPLLNDNGKEDEETSLWTVKAPKTKFQRSRTMSTDLPEEETFLRGRSSTAGSWSGMSEASWGAKHDKTKICKFWLIKRCERSDCKFAHGEEERRRVCATIMCQFAASGHCRLGSECPFAHSEESKQEASAVAENNAIGDHLQGADEEGFTEVQAKTRKTKKWEDNWNVYGKTQICKFALKNKCQRSDCQFAHSEEEQRIACRAIPCRNFARKGRCSLGSACMYGHPTPVDEISLEKMQKGSRIAKSPEIASRSSSSSDLTCAISCLQSTPSTRCGDSCAEGEKSRATMVNQKVENWMAAMHRDPRPAWADLCDDLSDGEDRS
eukprot:TRINITY_DN39403_c0_g1_i1.p1 TRINITY_DN39403_c0_g1~~TRINITY_DN39403_c0_g1_i1.p1  ORF type:complete len:595 (+),score=117.76 TRINITY_DN39403_c0_g1_i1:385-2169(+)